MIYLYLIYPFIKKINTKELTEAILFLNNICDNLNIHKSSFFELGFWSFLENIILINIIY